MITFIAEIGMNSDGNFDLNYELIRQAKRAGADIAKFQVGWRGSEEDINFLDLKRLQQLQDWCSQFDIEFMVSIITPEALDMVRKIGVQRYKVASRSVIDNPEMVRDLISDGKETFISLGMWNEKKFPFQGDNVKYLYCKSKYPTRYQDISDFPEEFDIFYGYSDHLMGLEGCLLAISRGAKIIEKHFTLNKTSTIIRDHALSASPEEFLILTDLGRNLSNLYDSLSDVNGNQ